MLKLHEYRKMFLSNSVSIILLSYNRPAFLAQALPSLLRQTHKNLEIIVVDNQSASSEEIGRLVGEYSSVKLIRNTVNLGFTGGMNRGLREASAEYVYLTEDDLIVEEHCIERLVEHMKGNPSTGLAAPIIFNEEDRTIRCAGAELALDGIFRKKVFGEGENDTGQFPQSFAVTAIQGSAIFGRLELLRRLKGFREDFFMYAEDNELCLRVLKLGFKIAVVPQARVFHCEQPGAIVTQKIQFHKLKNFFSLYLLHAPLRVLPEFYLRYGLINFLRALISDRRTASTMLKAGGWFLIKAPALIVERWRNVNARAT